MGIESIVLRDLVDSDNPIRRPIIALVVWAGVLGGWLFLASLAGVWPFADEHVAGGAAPPAPRVADAATAVARSSSAGGRSGRIPNVAPPELPRLFSPSHATGTASARSDIEITWTATDSADNAPVGYAYSWSTAADTEPEPLVLAPGDTVNLVSAPLPNGSWWFHLRATDRDGDWSGTAHLGPFIIQATTTATPAPTAEPTAIATPSPSPAPAAAAPSVVPTRVVTVAPPVPARTATPPPVPATQPRPAVQPTVAPPYEQRRHRLVHPNRPSPTRTASARSRLYRAPRPTVCAPRAPRASRSVDRGLSGPVSCAQRVCDRTTMVSNPTIHTFRNSVAVPTGSGGEGGTSASKGDRER
jgi:hypothetical protein